VAAVFELEGYDEPVLVIDHVNGKTHNNSIKNLQFITQKENARRGRGTRIQKIDQTGNILQSYLSITECVEENPEFPLVGSRLHKHGSYTALDETTGLNVTFQRLEEKHSVYKLTHKPLPSFWNICT
jgi:hypothetical protein